MSRYLFGLHLDGTPAPKDQQGLQIAFCGPMAFLSALEASLGIPPTETLPLQREIAYRDLLENSLTTDSFYARSFSCDPLATARLLLSWRDALKEAGWHDQISHGDASQRISCLFNLESDFIKTGQADATHAGRIEAILAELAHGSRPAVESVVVTDPKDTLPRCWQKLFDALDAQYEDVSPTDPLSPTNTTLGFVQSRLLGKTTEIPTESATLRIVTAATPEAAATALASQLTTLAPSTSTLIADSSERDFLNRHMQSLDLPLPTAKLETAAALLEIPSLLLRCRIAPLDPQAWIEFLLHSISPIPPSLRQNLAENINNTPGRGPHWEVALKACVSKAKDDDAIERLKESYASWIDVPFIGPNSLTGTTLADALLPLTQWITKRAGAKKSDDADNSSEWLIASRGIARLETMLRAEKTLTRTETNRLLAQWHQGNSTTTRFSGHVGSVAALDSPRQLLAPSEQVIWWRPAATRVRKSPWTKSELNWLSSNGISFPDETALAKAEEKSAERAVLLAGKSLTIYHVTQSAGTPTEQAGIITRLLAQGGDSLKVSARDLDHIPKESIPLCPLPHLRRWWNLKETNILPAREEESFSSVSKLIDFPMDWVLSYKAKLSLGPVASLRVSDDALRSGSILHSAAELLLDKEKSSLEWQTISETDFNDFLNNLFPGLLASQAAHYLAPGNEAAKSRILNTARQSLWHLLEILRDAKVTEVTLEKKIDPTPFVGGQIGGRIDLIARRADGKTAVIDLKLGGKGKRYEELTTNRHLQLATYGHLMLHHQEIDPATAYFILSNGGALLTRNDSFFPNINPVRPKRDSPSTDWKECWQEFEEIYQWRRQQLDQGRIEVSVPGTEADDPPPIDRWSPPKDGNPYSNYKNLTGFPLNA